MGWLRFLNIAFFVFAFLLFCFFAFLFLLLYVCMFLFFVLLINDACFQVRTNNPRIYVRQYSGGTECILLSRIVPLNETR